MAEEPIGIMMCWECVEKHSRDIEHHLEDIVRVTKEPSKRLQFEDWIDRVREIRKYAHTRARGIAVAPPQELERIAWEMRPLKSGNPSADWEKLKERHRAVVEAAKRLATPSGKEPIRRERGATTYTDIYHESAACHPRSHRAKRTDDHVLTFCCPYGLWDERLPAGQQCIASMMLQKIEHLHAEGQGSCQTCQG